MLKKVIVVIVSVLFYSTCACAGFVNTYIKFGVSPPHNEPVVKKYGMVDRYELEGNVRYNYKKFGFEINTLTHFGGEPYWIPEENWWHYEKWSADKIVTEFKGMVYFKLIDRLELFYETMYRKGIKNYNKSIEWEHNIFGFIYRIRE